MTNLWKILNKRDLAKFIKSDYPDDFIVIGIVNNATDESVKNYIKSLLRTKSKQYPEVKFVYYNIKTQDQYGLPPLAEIPSKEMNNYPKLYHICFSEITIKLDNVDCYEVMDESFDETHTIYMNASKIKKQRMIQMQNNQEEEPEQEEEPVHVPNIMEETKRRNNQIKLIKNKRKEIYKEFVKIVGEKAKKEENKKQKY